MCKKILIIPRIFFVPEYRKLNIFRHAYRKNIYFTNKYFFTNYFHKKIRSVQKIFYEIFFHSTKMVNTFVTEFFSKNMYTLSAKNLDIQRLRKQIVEAYQILRILEQIHHIVNLEGWDKCPGDNFELSHAKPKKHASMYLSRVNWVVNTRKRYMNLPYRYLIRGTEITKVPVNEKLFRLSKSDMFCVAEEGTSVTVWIKESDKRDVSYGVNVPSSKPRLRRREYKIPRDKIVLPEDEYYTLGFSQHAIVKMWVGYEDSLRMYINQHIDVYCTNKTKSGGNCSISIEKYTIPKLKTHDHPWWIVHYDGVVWSHRAALLRKERFRGESAWYTLNPKFLKTPGEYLNSGYVWTGSLGEYAHGIITRVLSNKKIYPHEVTAPITNDLPEILTQAQLKRKYNYTGEYTLDADGYVKVVIVR